MQPLLYKTTPFQQLAALLILCLVGFCMFSLIAAVSALVFGLGIGELPDLLANPGNPGVKNYLLFCQFLSAVFLFLLPPVVLVLFRGYKPLKGLFLQNAPSLLLVLLSMLLMLVALPVINFLAEFNQQLVLPEYFSRLQNWISAKETGAKVITESFMDMKGPVDLMIALLVMAVLPGIGEEMLFRASLQPILARLTRNKHIAVWITAFIFSFIHFQFLGFLPRFLMGAFLGYLFLWSNNTWLPAAAHFTNNATAVLISYFYNHAYLEGDPDEFGTGDNTLILVSLVLLAGGLLLFRFISRRHAMASVSS